jgi:hypothetical protein
MTPDEMESLIEAHLRAEGNGDPEGAVANYTEDIEHDVVGFPGSPLRGVPAALEFYRQLVKDIRTDGEERLHTYSAQRRDDHRKPDDRYGHGTVHRGEGGQKPSKKKTRF